MAHLPPQVIEQQRSQLSGEMLALWQPQQGKTWLFDLLSHLKGDEAYP